MSGRSASSLEHQTLAMKILHSAGWSNGAISRVLHISPPKLAKLMESERLSSNGSMATRKIDYSKALEMHQSGASDGEIARHFNVNHSAVTKWRQRHNIAPNIEAKHVGKDQVRRAKALLKAGATAQRVADEIGVSKNWVKRLRQRVPSLRTRRTGLTNRALASQARNDPGLLSKIGRAIGTSLPEDVRSEATMSLYSAVLEGLVLIEHLEEQAPKYRSAAWELCGSPFGPLSLDEDLGDGWTLGQSIADPGSLAEIDEDSDWSAYGTDD